MENSEQWEYEDTPYSYRIFCKSLDAIRNNVDEFMFGGIVLGGILALTGILGGITYAEYLKLETEKVRIQKEYGLKRKILIQNDLCNRLTDEMSIIPELDRKTIN